MEVFAVFVLDIPGYGLLELEHFVTDWEHSLRMESLCPALRKS